jgi:hypothetical protein
MIKGIIAVLLLGLAAVAQAQDVTEIKDLDGNLRIIIVAEKATREGREIKFLNILSIKTQILDRPQKDVEIKKMHEHIQVPYGYSVFIKKVGMAGGTQKAGDRNIPAFFFTSFHFSFPNFLPLLFLSARKSNKKNSQPDKISYEFFPHSLKVPPASALCYRTSGIKELSLRSLSRILGKFCKAEKIAILDKKIERGKYSIQIQVSER